MIFGDVLTIKNGRNQKAVENPKGKYPIYGSGGVMGYADDYICSANTVVIGRKGSINNPIFVECPFWNVDTAFGLEAKTEVLIPRYLYYFCKHFNFEKLNKTVTIPSLTKSDLLRIEIDLPEIPKQQSIVSQLSKIEDVISFRQQQLQKLDELVKARFVELFGDPVRNPMQWDTYPLEECLERIDNGKSFICSDKPRTDNNPAILKLSAATYGDYRPHENKALLDESLFVESAEVHAGDLLFTRKNTPELVGMAAYVQNTPSKLMMPDLIFRLVPNEKINAVFLWQLINCKEFRPVIQAISGGSAKSMSNISKERLGKLKVICPPRELQDSLIPFVKQVDKSKVVESIHRMNVLFNITLNGGNRYDIRANEF